MTKLHIIISGRVQDVGFRFFVERLAESLSLAGSAQNLSDGTVEVIAYGTKEGLERLLEACRKGPQAARVDDVRVEWGEDLFSPGSLL